MKFQLLILFILAGCGDSVKVSGTDVPQTVVHTTDEHVEGQNIINTTTSVVMNEISVLPPNVEKLNVTVTSFKTHLLDQCESIPGLKKENVELENKKNKILLGFNDLNEDLLEKQNALAVVRTNLENFVAKKNLSELLKLDDEIDKNTPTDDQLKKRIELQVGIKNSVIYDYQKQRSRMIEKLYPYLFARELLENNKKSIEQIEKKQNELFASLKINTGAIGSVEFYSSWDENIKKLNLENPGHDFKKMSLKTLSIKTRIAGLDNLPVISPFSVMPDELSNGEYPESIVGKLELNLLAACMAYKPHLFDSHNEPGKLEIILELDSTF